MEKREILIIIAIFLIIFTTVFFIYLNLREKVLFSPQEENLPPIETLPLDQFFCYDSDEGLNYFQKGVVVWGVGDGEVHRSADYCTLNDPVWGTGTLFEMYCVGDSFKIKDMKCAVGSCKEGVCVS